MFRELRIGKDLLGEFQPIFVLLVFVAFLQKNRNEEVNTRREIDKACSSHKKRSLGVPMLLEALTKTYQYSFEQSVLFGW